MPMLAQGHMPQAGGTYEEFETLLARFFLSLHPPIDYIEGDEDDLKEALRILDDFAARHQVQRPQEAARDPRYGKPAPFESCTHLFDNLDTFWRTFGVGLNPTGEDSADWRRLKNLVIRIFKRHRVGEVVTIWDPIKSKLPLGEVFLQSVS